MTHTSETYLLKSHTELTKQLEDRINRGLSLHSRDIVTPNDLKQLQEDYFRWNDYNLSLLKNIATTDEFTRDYRPPNVKAKAIPDNRTINQKHEELRDEISDKINRLRSILERMDLYKINEIGHHQHQQYGNRVFIVHGRDSATRDSVARFVEKHGLEAIILDEKTNAGQTIIEKFEEYSDVGYAIILLTPDDVGALKSENQANLRPRARQNVIFELGYFIGKLSRRRVCILVKDEVEIPSDIKGWGFISFAEQWQYKLTQEMKSAGLPIED